MSYLARVRTGTIYRGSFIDAYAAVDEADAQQYYERRVLAINTRLAAR